MAATLFFLALLAVSAPAQASAAKVTPVQKVLEMLHDLVVKADAEKKEEAVKFSAFSQWCDDQKRIKTNEIEEANEKIEKLKAMIEKYEAEIRELTDRIEELEEDIGRWKKDMKSATEVREKEADDYVVTLQDYSESIAALEQAIAVLKKQMFDRPQAEEALLQVRSLKLVPLASKKALLAFLQETQPESLFYEAPEAAAYTFQSGGVVEMLEKLEDEFKTKKMEMEEEELSARHAYEQIMQQLNDNIENAEHEIERKKELLAETEAAKAEAEGDLAQTTAERDADQKYLDDLIELCAQKKMLFEARQKLREEELEALKKAIEIISSETVAGAAEKHLPTLVQVAASHRSGTALAQIRGTAQGPTQARVVEFLAGRAKASKSRLLAMVSEQIKDSPFTKVKKMIKDLIVKLMEEATSEAEHKGWCDTELTTNKQSRDKLTSDIEKLNTQIEDLTADIAQLTQDIEEATARIAELDAAMAKATSDRDASKAKNQETIQEAKDAQAAVEAAMAILKDFYAKSAQATALAQQTPAEDAPETFTEPYKGALPEGGSIIDFLEVILSDFARLESETTTAEAMEAEEYKNFMFESEKDKALRENEIKLKSETKTKKEKTLQEAKEELAMKQEDLDKAIAYYEKLKPTCVDSGITYEERVKRREEEIQSLKEALAILKGADMPEKLDRSGDVDF